MNGQMSISRFGLKGEGAFEVRHRIAPPLQLHQRTQIGAFGIGEATGDGMVENSGAVVALVGVALQEREATKQRPVGRPARNRRPQDRRRPLVKAGCRQRAFCLAKTQSMKRPPACVATVVPADTAM